MNKLPPAIEEAVLLLNAEWIDKNGDLILRPANVVKELPHDLLRYWLWYNAQYFMPTNESIIFLKDLIGDQHAIEIGAGNGWVGKHLGITMTDNFLQRDNPVARMLYVTSGQPTINYRDGVVEKLDALEAIEKYKPHTVIGTWVTQLGESGQSNMFGIDEEKILKSVKRYIVVGSVQQHNEKKILRHKHTIYQPSALASRSAPGNDRVWVWER